MRRSLATWRRVANSSSALALVALATAIAWPPQLLAGTADTTEWAETVEYKLSLKLPCDDTITPTVAAVQKAWIKAHKATEFAATDCRTITFFDAPDERLRKVGIALRERVGRSNKTCFDDAGKLRRADKWDVRAKWTAVKRSELPGAAELPPETDWLAGAGGDRVRFAAAKTVKVDGSDVPSRVAELVETLALPEETLPGLGDAKPICNAPIEELRWEGEDGEYEPTLTVWRLADEIIAAEVSFKGGRDDLGMARRLQDALRASHLLEPIAKSKMEVVYGLCAGEA